MEVIQARLPLPKSEARLQELMVQLLRLPMLQKLELTPGGIEVHRGVRDDGEAVVPESLRELAQGIEPPEPDIPFMLGRLEMTTLEPDPERHQLTTLVEMMERVRKAQLISVAWYVATGDALDAFLCNPKGSMPTHLLGLPVHYVADTTVPEDKLVLVGSPTQFRIDATFAVAAEIG